MKIKENRSLSFIFVAAVYLLAAILGVLLYMLLPFSWWIDLLIADILATVFVFIFSLIFKNASVYDPYWSVQPIVILWGFAAASGIDLPRALALFAVSFWGIRLTANWAYTFHGLTHQDWRYTMLAEKTGPFYPVINFVGIHMVPTLVVYLCTLPAVFVFVNDCSLNPLSVAAILLSVGAAVLQGIADIQMQSFRKERKSAFIRTGLWKYSRHPNYLGEILMWWGIGIFAVSMAPNSWYLLSGAVANTLLFTFVSIPMAEKRQSKKEGFSEYKKATRVMLPIKK